MLAGHHAAMDQAGSIALSGLQAASLRLEAAASNIVNSGSDAYQPVTVSQSPSPGSGVRATLLAYDPSAPYASLQESVAPQGVDLPSELVNLKLAEHDFRAGLLAYKASAEMFQTLLDATG